LEKIREGAFLGLKIELAAKKISNMKASKTVALILLAFNYFNFINDYPIFHLDDFNSYELDI